MLRILVFNFFLFERIKIKHGNNLTMTLIRKILEEKKTYDE